MSKWRKNSAIFSIALISCAVLAMFFAGPAYTEECYTDSKGDVVCDRDGGQLGDQNNTLGTKSSQKTDPEEETTPDDTDPILNVDSGCTIKEEEVEQLVTYIDDNGDEVALLD